jgi:hypothetical protein
VASSIDYARVLMIQSPPNDWIHQLGTKPKTGALGDILDPNHKMGIIIDLPHSRAKLVNVCEEHRNCWNVDM